MITRAQELLDEVLGLPDEERDWFVESLTRSLNSDEITLSPAWKAEIKARIAAVEAGEMRVLSEEEFFRELESE